MSNDFSKKRHLVVSFTLFCLLLLGLGGCGDSPDKATPPVNPPTNQPPTPAPSPSPDKVISIDAPGVASSAVTVEMGDTLQFTASPAAQPSETTVWSSTNITTASVDQNGLLTPLAPGTTSISAKRGISSSNSVTVTVRGLTSEQASILSDENGDLIDISSLPINQQGSLPSGDPDPAASPLPDGDPFSYVDPAMASLPPVALANVPNTGTEPVVGPEGSPDPSVPLMKVFGSDDRLSVINTSTYPWRAQCKVFTYWYKKGTRSDNYRPPNGVDNYTNGQSFAGYVGSGVFIGPNHVLTCAHNVFNHPKRMNATDAREPGQWVAHITVSPGHTVDTQGNPKAAWGNYRISRKWALEGWLKNGDFNYDIAVLEVAHNAKPGNKVGYLGFRVDSNVPDGTTGNLSGYSSSLSEQYTKQRGGNVQTYGYGPIKRYSTNNWIYSIDSNPGSSGGPLYTINNGVRQAVGVNVYESDNHNGAARLSRRIFDQIRAIARP